MQHLTEQELVLHHYHDEDSPAAVAQHLTACDVCRAEYNSIQRVLALVDEMPIPERVDNYGEHVWTRLAGSSEARGGRHGNRSSAQPRGSPWASSRGSYGHTGMERR